MPKRPPSNSIQGRNISRRPNTGNSIGRNISRRLENNRPRSISILQNNVREKRKRNSISPTEQNNLTEQNNPMEKRKRNLSPPPPPFIFNNSTFAPFVPFVPLNNVTVKNKSSSRKQGKFKKFTMKDRQQAKEKKKTKKNQNVKKQNYDVQPKKIYL